MSRFIFTTLLALPMFFLTTCHKSKTGGGMLPENTDVDYFECKINGVQWAGPLTDLHLNYYCACDSVLNITAYRQGEGYNELLCLITDEAVVGDSGNVIAGSSVNNGGVLFGEAGNPNPCLSSHYFLYRNGKVFLEEHNTEKHYLKGTFWINGRSPNCTSDTVMEITEGRFLVHY